jgi:hypothetical protein
MKKILIFAVAVFSSAILFTSCKKEKTDEITNVTLDVSINAGETYKLDLSQYGDADDFATITTQATTFTTSEIAKVGTIGEYNFMKAGNPKVGGNGSETVVLKVEEGVGNGRCSGDSLNVHPHPQSGDNHHGKKHIEETNITINFTIL